VQVEDGVGPGPGPRWGLGGSLVMFFEDEEGVWWGYVFENGEVGRGGTGVWWDVEVWPPK
jgi:hypothetical protein